jgi:hypothetical protein
MMDGLLTYKIGNECVITLQPSTGYVSVVCPWHNELNGAHYWSRRGPADLKSFLAQLDRHYTVGKLFGSNQTTEFDLEGTVNGIKKWIIEERRNGGLDSERARECFDAAEVAETEDCLLRDSAFHGIDDFHTFLMYRDKHCVGWWWDNCWGAFVAQLKAELAADLVPA